MTIKKNKLSLSRRSAITKETCTAHNRFLTWSLAIALMIWILVLVTCSQMQMSPTFDEQNHVTRGIAILQTGDFGLSFHHPPLANIIEALPVAWMKNGFSTETASWRERKNPQMIWPVSAATIWGENNSDAPAGIRLIQLARLPVLLFTLVLALVVFLWSKELFGPWGGLFSLTLFALDPTVLAHSGLATTDMAAACTIVLAIFFLRQYIIRPSIVWLIIAGAGIGLALVTKFSALILLPILTVLLFFLAWRAPALPGSLPAMWAGKTPGIRYMRAIVQGVILIIIAGVVVWAMYGFKVEAPGSKPGEQMSANVSFMRRLPVPALQYLRGIKAVKEESKGKPAYLFGQTDNTGKGWWYFFPISMLTKTPIPALCAIFGILLLLSIPRTRALLALPCRELLFLLMPVAVFTLAAVGAFGMSWNMGIRHILPIYPFLYILAGGWAMLNLRRVIFFPTFAVVLLTQVASLLAAYPDYIAYFNEIARWKGNDSTIFVDSNIDWGQDLGRLAIMQREYSLYPLDISYFGSTPFEAYGIACKPIDGFRGNGRDTREDFADFHGYLAISLTNIMAGEAYAGVDYRSILRDKTPIAQAGSTILIYRFP